MKIRLKHVTPDDERATAQLEPGEIVAHEVELDVDGRPRTFTVYLKANVVPDRTPALPAERHRNQTF